VDSQVQLKERQIRDIEIRPARAEDSLELALNLRAADCIEVKAAYGWGPLEAVEHSRQQSKAAFTVLYKQVPALMFGIADMPSEPGTGGIWLLGTDEVRHFRKHFVRHSQDYLSELCNGYQIVTNCVDERHRESIRWLRSIGAIFIHRHTHFGVARKPFLEFILKCVEYPQS